MGINLDNPSYINPRIILIRITSSSGRRSLLYTGILIKVIKPIKATKVVVLRYIKTTKATLVSRCLYY